MKKIWKKIREFFCLKSLEKIFDDIDFGEEYYYPKSKSTEDDCSKKNISI